jgi:hypothetical protein
MSKNIVYLLVGLAAIALIYWLTTKNTGQSMAKEALTEFAIKDTASVGKIFIADNKGKLTLERKDDGFWSLNDTLIAMPSAVKLMMKTFRQVGIQQPVPKSQRATVMKIINGDNRKVKIYDRQGKWIKTWYVGRATRSNQGTYAILETPEDGLSPDPFVIEIRGFRGFLTTRFHSKVNDWRWTGIFHYPGLELANIKVDRPRIPEESFQIDIGDRFNGEFSLKDSQGLRIPGNKSAMSSLLAKFEHISFEHFDPQISATGADSLLALPPNYSISVTDKKGETTSCDIYMKVIAAKTRDAIGAEVDAWDPERVFVIYRGELLSGQRLVFDDLMKSKTDMTIQ